MTKKIFSVILIFATVSASFFAEKYLTPVKTENFLKNQIKNIDIQVLYEDIDIEEIYGDEISVAIFGNNLKTIPSISLRSDSLVIESNQKSFIPGAECDVKIYVPQDAKFSNVKISSASGEIDCKILAAEEKIKIESKSGDLEIENAGAKEIEVNTTSGEISLKRISCDALTAQSRSGEIDVEDFFGEYIAATTASGEIEIKRLNAEYFSFNSERGEISVDFRTVPVASSKIETTSGDIRIFAPRKGFSLTASSNSGTFRDKINDNLLVPRSDFSQKYYGGGTDIFVKTTSGEILLEN